MLISRPRKWYADDCQITVGGRLWGLHPRSWDGNRLRIDVLGHAGLELRRASSLAGKVELLDTTEDQVLATAGKAGLFTSDWKMALSSGEMTLKPEKLARFIVTREEEPIGFVDRTGWLHYGWKVDVPDEIPRIDQLMLGMIFICRDVRDGSTD